MIHGYKRIVHHLRSKIHGHWWIVQDPVKYSVKWVWSAPQLMWIDPFKCESTKKGMYVNAGANWWKVNFSNFEKLMLVNFKNILIRARVCIKTIS